MITLQPHVDLVDKCKETAVENSDSMVTERLVGSGDMDKVITLLYNGSEDEIEQAKTIMADVFLDTQEAVTGGYESFREISESAEKSVTEIIHEAK